MNPALPRIYLVRHGDTAWTLTAQHTGRTEIPLSEQGERQARELRASLTGLRFDRILSSPLQRARRTAELAMPRSSVEADDDLMEWDYGAYEGRSTVDIEVERPGWRLLRDGTPAARRSMPWPRVPTVSLALFAQAAAMCSSSAILKSCAFLRCASASSACSTAATNGVSLVATSRRRYLGVAPEGAFSHFLIVLRDRLVRRRISLIVSPSR